MQLRPYQREAVDSINRFFESGYGNPLVVAPTGAGKSVMMAAYIGECVEQWPGTRIMVLAHVKELLEQNASAIGRMYPSLDVGLFSAGLKRRDCHNAVIVAGIQSVFDKSDDFGHIDIAIVDECHLINPRQMGRYRDFIAGLRLRNPHIKVVGFTATPYRLGHGYIHKGDDAMFNGIAYDIPIELLIERGYLVRPMAKAGKVHADLSAVHIRGGEFVESEAAAAFDPITQEAVKDVILRTRERHCGLVFCTGLDHAEKTAEAFRSFGETSVEVVSGNTHAKDRARMVADIKAGRLRWLINVAVFCLDEQTEILTASGWVGIDEMSESHEIACWNKDGTIYFSKPKGMIKRQRFIGEKMVSLKSKHHDIRVTSLHRMAYKTSSTLGWKESIAGDLADRRFYIPVSGVSEPFKCDLKPITVSGKKRLARIRSLSYVYRKRDGHSANIAKQLAEKEVNRRISLSERQVSELTEAECRFIGLWLGDGTFSGGRCSITQSKRYPFICDIIEGTLNEIGIHYCKTEYDDNFRWTLASGMGSKHQSRISGHYKYKSFLNKNGTPLFWGLNEKQFESLIYGFWLADGNHGSGVQYKNEGHIAGTQHDLYEILQCVGTCRGFRFSIIDQKDRGNPKHNRQWSMSWHKTDKMQLSNDRLSVEKTPHKSERVWCVTSESSFIITRRNGRVVVTGNTTGFDAPNIDVVVFLRATQSTALYVQIIGRGLRLHEGKETCLVLDYGENVQRHGPLNFLRIKEPGDKIDRDEVRAKPCPQCEELIPINARECPICRYVFPVEERSPNHGTEAAEVDLLAGGGPQWVEVLDMSVHRHRKFDKTPSMRVVYRIGQGPFDTVSEWVCFDHGGYAAGKAAKWARERGADWMPLEDALHYPWPTPTRVCIVRNSNSFVNVIAAEFEHEFAEVQGV